MTTIHRRERGFGRFLPSIMLLACLAATGAQADLAGTGLRGWKIEEGVDDPSYAVVEPTTTNLNIDTVVLACEGTGEARVLQLQLYLADDRPLQPKASAGQLKDDPRAEISIDGRTFPATLLFADDYVVLADGQRGRYPMLSHRLISAMQTGKTMVLRFDLIAKRPGQPPTFDGEAVVDLRAPGGRDAIAAMRRCAQAEGRSRIGSAMLRH